MSDHVHTVVTDERGELPNYLRKLRQVLALFVKSLRKWEGPVWEPCSVSTVELLTAEAEAQEISTPGNPDRVVTIRPDEPRRWGNRPGARVIHIAVTRRARVSK